MSRNAGEGGLSLVEKIAARHAVGLPAGARVCSGDTVTVQPAHVLTHDNTGAVIPKFRAIGAQRFANPRQPVFALDHNVQDTGEANRTKYRKIEAFAREMGVDFYPAGRGIGHQVMCEEGYAWPGTLVVASDSHANTYGALGCLGTPVVRTDAAALWATGRTWWRIPPVARVVLEGALRPGVTGKDVILSLCARFKDDEVLNHAVEFAGEGVSRLSMADRFTMANMTTEWGALAGLFPVDAVTLAWLEARIAFVEQRGLAGVPSDEDGGGRHPRLNRERLAALAANPPAADPDAHYAVEITLDLGSVVPWAAGPHHVKKGAPAGARGELTIRKAYLLSCVNGRVEDFAAAAQVLRGQKVAPGVSLYIAAASIEVQAESERRGDWGVLLDAGARVLPPGCGPCIGLGAGLLEAGERGISATNRNFKGRMGSRDAEAFLASPAVVAASAAAGRIVDPFGYEPGRLSAALRRPEAAPDSAQEVTIVEGFPAVVEGELLFCPRDNLNTDGIFPGKYTYIDDFSPEQQASVVMENYDPAFRETARAGDILAGGFNFGTGSSREQAATALLHKGIRLVLAGSFSETYKRNAVNNGFLAVEAPGLVRRLKERFGEEALTVRTGLRARVDFRAARVQVGEERFPMAPVGPAAQEIIVSGGLGPWVRRLLDAGAHGMRPPDGIH